MHVDVDEDISKPQLNKKQRRKKALAVKEKVKTELLKKTTYVTDMPFSLAEFTHANVFLASAFDELHRQTMISQIQMGVSLCSSKLKKLAARDLSGATNLARSRLGAKELQISQQRIADLVKQQSDASGDVEMQT